MFTRILRSGAQLYDANDVSRETGHDPGTARFPSKTIQSEKDNCDINVIVKRFKVTGQMPGTMRLPEYGDYEGVGDFHTAMQVIRSATESFMSMPAAVRARFGNDPQSFLEFCSDVQNIDELRKMGLAIPKKDDIIPVPDVPVKEKPSVSNSKGRAGKSGKASGVSEGASGEDEGNA